MGVPKTSRTEGFFPFLAIGCLFVLFDGLALLVASPFEAAGVSVFENPDNPFNIVFLFLTMMVFTAIILVVSRFLRRLVVQGMILIAVAVNSFFVFYPLLALVIPDIWSLGVSLFSTALLITMLIRYPEWYVIDICATIVGVGTIAMMGISLNVSLVIILLIVLAAYDAISVYKTRHMIALANTVLELRSPVMLVIPKTRGYSQIKETKSLKEQLERGEERGAFVIGLGDFVFPGILAVSAFNNIEPNGFLVAISVLLGTLLGLIPLLASVARGKPQAGLPLLCSGAILAYFASTFILMGRVLV